MFEEYNLFLILMICMGLIVVFIFVPTFIGGFIAADIANDYCIDNNSGNYNW